MRRTSLLVLLYLAVGVVFAVTRRQLTMPLMRDFLEVLLFIVLWPLNALGLLSLNL
jgi:hypothetical protein